MARHFSSDSASTPRISYTKMAEVGSGSTYGGKPPDTPAFFLSPWSEDISTEICSGKKGRQYSQHACHEYCLNLTDVGQISVGLPFALTLPVKRVDCWIPTTFLDGPFPFARRESGR